MTELQPRIALVTGASKGIGRGIARVFAARGYQVAVMARHLEGAQAVAEEIQADGALAALALAGDVTSLASVQEAVATVTETWGGLDVLCANAGIFPSADLETMSEAEWDLVINTNLKGMFLSVQAAIPALKQSKAGRIVVTSSITGPITGFPGWAHYGASKAGQLGFVRTAAIELAKYGITINAVMPGNIVTEGLDGMGENYLRQMAASIPLKRLGSVEDIGEAAAFFASLGASYITGQTLVVDGGQVLPESLEAVG